MSQGIVIKGKTVNDQTVAVRVDDDGLLQIGDISVGDITLDPAGLATAVAQTDGTQKSQIVDAGGEAATVTGGKLDVNASIDTTGLALAANQLPDGHNVSVDNLPSNYPLPAAQITTLTPPAAITGFATSAKQDTIIGHVDGIESFLNTIDADTAAMVTDLAAMEVLLTDIEGNQLPDGHEVEVNNFPAEYPLPASQVTTLTPPAAITGFATETTLDAVKTAVQLIDNFISGSRGLVTEDNSAAIKTAVETIDNAISGSEMQVDVVGALPAGTNAIGKLAANSGVDIGDVDVTSAVSSSFDHGSNLDIDTSAEQITSTSFACKFGVTVKSAVDNTDTVYIGNSDVTAGTTAATDGFPLEPGESITLPVNNSNLLYAIGATANQKVFWSAV